MGNCIGQEHDEETTPRRRRYEQNNPVRSKIDWEWLTDYWKEKGDGLAVELLDSQGNGTRVVKGTGKGGDIGFWNGNPQMLFAAHIKSSPHKRVLLHPGQSQDIISSEDPLLTSPTGIGLSWSLHKLPAQFLHELSEKRQTLIYKLLSDIPVGSTAEAALKHAIKNKTFFIDPTFPPTNVSLGQYPVRKVVPSWAPPREYLRGMYKLPAVVFCSEEQLPRATDIDQGSLGDCWILAVLSVLSEKHLIQRVFSTQTSQEREVGAHRLSFCKDGWWGSVLTDEYFPVHGYRPVFAWNRSRPNELWVPLIEKAFAKMKHNYSALTGGCPSRAFGDLTGFPYWNFYSLTPQLFDTLCGYLKQGHVVTVGTRGVDPRFVNRGSAMKQNKKVEQYLSHNGLIPGHSYCVLRAVSRGSLKIVLLRDPWGVSCKRPVSTDCSSDVGLQNFLKQQEPEINSGCFWIPWSEMLFAFDGGTVGFLVSSMREIRIKIPTNSGLILQFSEVADATSSVIIHTRSLGKISLLVDSESGVWSPVAVQQPSSSLIILNSIKPNIRYLAVQQVSTSPSINTRPSVVTVHCTQTLKGSVQIRMAPNFYSLLRSDVQHRESFVDELKCESVESVSF